MSSISWRVARTNALSVALAGIVVALAGIALDQALYRFREDDHLFEAARIFAAELAEPGADPLAVAADETREYADAGIRMALFDGTERLFGDARIGRPAVGQCIGAAAMRACAVSAPGRRVAVAARADAQRPEQRATLLLSLALAVVLTTALGAGVAGRLARWSLAPLERLSARVSRIDAVGASDAHFGPDEGVAEVDHLRATLTATFVRLAAALGHAQRFAGDAAHELRTPLTTVRTELDLLAERIDVEVDSAAVNRVRRTTERLALLVERLLVLAQPADALQAAEPVDMRDLAEDFRAEQPPETRARITIDAMDGLPPLSGDPTLLAVMLGCGIENALKFSNDGPVLVRLAKVDDALLLEIDDEGPGVPHAERESLFRPFHRSPSARARNTPGHGIGLSLVAHVAALHRGRASFEDGARGARLRIVLPLRGCPEVVGFRW